MVTHFSQSVRVPSPLTSDTGSPQRRQGLLESSAVSPDPAAMDQGKQQWWLELCTQELWGLAAGACSGRGNC